MTLHETHKKMFERYLSKLQIYRYYSTDDYRTSYPHLIWMCEEMIKKLSSEKYPIDKAARWLGFVQGCLTERNIITVDEERDFSRPLFTPHYNINDL